MVLTLANSYLLVFYTKVMGVPAGIIGTLFMLARFVDAFTDMAVGRIVDTHTDRNGDRYRSWIAYFSLPLVISSCLMYNYFLADSAMAVKIVWLTVTYLLFGSVCYTAVSIPYGAMSAVVSDNPEDRTSLSTWRNMGSQIAGVVLGIVLPLVIYVKDENGNDVASGPRFLLMAVTLGALALIGLLICWKWSVERVHIADQKQEKEAGKSNGGKVLIACLKDRSLMTTILFGIFMNSAFSLFMTFNQYMFLDYFGNPQMSGLSSLIMFVSMIICAPFIKKLSSRVGKKELGIIGTALALASYAVMFITRVSNVAFYFVGVFAAFFGIGLLAMINYAMMNDNIDNHYLESGDQVGGTVYALSGFTRKMAGAVTTGIGGWGLAWIHYDELVAVQTEAVRQSLFNLAMGLPLACFALSLIFLFFYPLNKAKVAENVKRMEEMNRKQ